MLNQLKISESLYSSSFDDLTLEQKVKILVLRDLIKLDWTLSSKDKKVILNPPFEYNKDSIKYAMSVRRNDLLKENEDWIEKNIETARGNLANGNDVLKSKIIPAIEECKTQKQHDLFRIYRYSWSSPYSEYVGRRIKLIIRDNGLPNKPVIGIAALGSPIIHIPDRDEFIGWDIKTRTKNLIYTMDAYVIGALPPYNYLLGGKLISYILASKEVREIYRRKYKDKVTIKEKRKASKLVGIFTTSLYGHSSQYNRIKFRKNFLYQPIGQTRGYGSLHLSNETICAMVELLQKNNILVSNKFGDGPSWIMRVIRSAGELVGFDADTLLHHSFRRNIYFVPLAKNYKQFLNGKTKLPKYYDYSMDSLARYWRKRWLKNRKLNEDIRIKILNFRKEDFEI